MAKGKKKNQRVIFKATVVQFMQKTKEQSYGQIYLYDDLTQQKLLRLFSGYKKERIKYLRSCGVKVKESKIRNALRDHTWLEMVKRYKTASDYKKIAQEWAVQNTFEAKQLLLANRWTKPGRCVDLDLEEKITVAKKKSRSFEEFLTEEVVKLNDQSIKGDLEEYVQKNLPKLIRSAVHRYRKK